METDEPNEPVAEETKAPDEGTCKVTPEPERKPVKTPEVPQPMVSGEDTELEEIKAENRRLRELMTSLQQKQQITSLEFSEIRDKYALKQREISELNTQLQDSEYDLQKANHRVENLVKRLNELEEMKKKIREGDIPSKQESNLDGQAIQIPESIVVQSSPYKCLQSQFTVLFNEVSTDVSVNTDVKTGVNT
ncbi:hypothetical protein QZH41_014762 [Actinostola sp. cb2023]|nr:hypothetical protein QZH41_014762 [Actinostola sp. cb2023]